MSAQPAMTNAKPAKKPLTIVGTEAVTEVLPAGETISDEKFDDLVRGTLDAVGGIMLFKMTTGEGEESQHVAVASIGAGGGRQFFVLTLPVSGGQLRVETAAKSGNPLAGIAASYASLAEAFATAA